MSFPVQRALIKPSFFLRALLSIVGLFVLVIAFVVLFDYPLYAIDALYLLIAWIVASFLSIYLLRRTRAPPIPSGALAGPIPSSSNSSVTRVEEAGPEFPQGRE